MTKNILFLFAFLSLSVWSYSQDKVIDAITDETCKCLESKNMDKLSSEEIQMELGLCMINAAGPYSKELKKKHGIDVMDGGPSAEKLGKKVGMKLVTNCPVFMQFITQMVEEEGGVEELQEKTREKKIKTESLSGSFQGISGSDFGVVNIKDANSRNHKVYIFTSFEGQDQLLGNEDALKGKNMTVNYSEMEVFNNTLRDYNTIKVLKSFRVD